MDRPCSAGDIRNRHRGRTLLLESPPARRIKTAATVAVAGYLVTIGSWWFGWNGRFLDGDSMWFSLFCGLAAIAAAVAFRPAYAFLVLCIVVPATVTINHIVRAPPELNGPLLPDMAWAFAFSLIYFAAAVMAMRIAAILDSTRAQAYAATAEASALHARLTERQRFAQLTHDGSCPHCSPPHDKARRTNSRTKRV